MSYEIYITTKARKEMKKLPASAVKQIRAKLDVLAENPATTELDVKPLQGESFFRLRVGNYRVIYDLQHDALVVEVIRVRHRQAAYK